MVSIIILLFSLPVQHCGLRQQRARQYPENGKHQVELTAAYKKRDTRRVSLFFFARRVTQPCAAGRRCTRCPDSTAAYQTMRHKFAELKMEIELLGLLKA